jgi:hypothetical protein
MRVLAGAEGSVMGFIASWIRICCQPASPATEVMTHNVYITKLVKPKVVSRVGRRHEVAFTKLLVGLRGRNVKLVQDPLLNETLVASGLLPDQEIRRWSS